MIKVRTLGAAEIVIGKKRITPKTEVMFALAVYLCVRAGERISRDGLAELFWPESGLEKARHSLRQMLYRLRKAGVELDESSTVLSLSAKNIELDFADFLAKDEHTLFPGPPPAELPAFLDAFRAEISVGFGRWLDQARSRVSTHARAGAALRLTGAQNEARWQHTIRWSELILNSDPLNQEAALARARATAMLGSPTVAISMIDAFSEESGDEHGAVTKPAAALRKRIFEKRAEWGARAARPTPLIGREALVARLSALIDGAARGQGGAVALVGAGGVGKSRLCEEARSIAELNGFRCVSIRADIAQGHRPLATTVHIATALRDLPGAAGSSPVAYAVISRLTRIGDDPQPLTGNGHGDIPLTQIQWALGDLLSAVCSEQKLLLIIDDTHNIDGDSWNTFASLMAMASTMRAAVIATGRALPASDAAPMHLTRISVPPLTKEAALTLTEAISSERLSRSRGASLSAIARASGGNPLFIRELLAHRETSSSVKLPLSLQNVIDRRLSSLSSAHIRLLRLVSLLGEQSTVSRVQALAALPASSVSSILEEMEHDGIISLTETGTVLIHECWREGVLDASSSAALASIGLECARELSAETHDHELLDRLWLTADLFARAHELRSARLQLRLAGRVLLARGISRQAAEAFSRALSLQPDAEEAAELYERMAWSESQAGHFSAAISASRSGLSILRTTGTPLRNVQVQLLSTLADSLWREGLPHSDALTDMLSHIEDPDVDDASRRDAALVAMRLIYVDARDSRADFISRVVDEANSRTAPSLSGELARLIHASESGKSDEIAIVARSIAILSDQPQPPLLLAKAVRYRAAALRFTGKFHEAEAAALEAARKAGELGQQEEELNALHALVFLYLDEDNLQSAQLWLEKSRQRHYAAAPTAIAASLLHAEGRFLLHSRKYLECLSHFLPHIEAIRTDETARRRVASLACVAAAAAECNQTSLARETVAHCIETIEQDSPCFQLDYAIDVVVGALERLGDQKRANEIGREYWTRRAVLYPRPIPVSYVRLRALSTTQ